MAIIKLGLENFESLILNEYENDGYYPVSLEQLKEHELFTDLLKILKAVKPDFDVNNVFTLSVTNGYPTALYGFSLVKRDDKAVLQFGAGNEKNEVGVACEIVQDEAGDDVPIFKAGNATLIFSLNNQGSIMTNLKFGKNQISIFTKWQKDVSFEELENCESVEDFTSLLDTLGVAGLKLTDLVRPYVRSGKGLPNGGLVFDVTSWVIQEPHPEYGTSVLFNIKPSNSEYVAMTKEGLTVNNPGAVYISANQMSAMVIQKPEFAKKAVEAMATGGKLQLIIPAISKKEPEKYNPSNLLKIVLGTSQATKVIAPSNNTKVVKTVEIDEEELELLEKF